MGAGVVEAPGSRDADDALAWIERSAAAAPLQAVPAGGAIGDAAAADAHLFVLHEGWAAGSIDLPDGGRQILKVHLPGDVMGAPSLAVDGFAETLTALTAVRVRPVPLGALGVLFAERPRLAAQLFLSAQEDRVMLMDRLAVQGRLEAEARLAWFLLHLRDRLAPDASDLRPSTFELRMTQPQIADAIGLTAVHVNRLLRRFDRADLISRRGRVIELVCPQRLRRAAMLPRRTPLRAPSWLPQADHGADRPRGA